MSAGPMRYCHFCGAVNPPDVDHCISCRRVLPDREPPAAGNPAQPPAYGYGGQPTQPAQPGPITWNDPFGGVPGQGPSYGYGQGASNPQGGYGGEYGAAPGGYAQPSYPEYDYGAPAYGAPQPADTAYDPYAAYGTPTEAYGYDPAVYPQAQPQPQSQAQAYAAPDNDQSPPPPPPPSEPARPVTAARQPLPPPIRRESGRGGCLMGCLAVLIIGILGAVFIGIGVVQPLLENQVGDELERVVGTQVAQQIAPTNGTPELTAGTYTISAAEITTQLRESADDFGPIESPELAIDPDGLELRFDAFGQESSYRGGVAAEDGRIVLTDVAASGLATRVLSADDAQDIIEGAFNTYISDAGLTVSAVSLGDGELTITTEGRGSTAGTPVAASSPAARATPRASVPTATQTPRATARPTQQPTASATPTPQATIPRPTPTRTPTPEDTASSDPTPPGDGTGL